MKSREKITDNNRHMGKYKKIDSKEQKEYIFTILSDFADYCEDNGLDYSLCGGTLLGAVRHKDFIPWDDDVDVFMPRPDYVKLHRLLKEKKIKNNYIIKSLEAGNADFPFAKIIDTDTKLDPKYYSTDRNLWIDIFPIDGLPQNKEKGYKILVIANKIKKMYEKSVIKIGTGKTQFRALAKMPVLIVFHGIGAKRFGTILNKIALRYDYASSEIIGAIAWSCGKCERMKKKIFEKKTYLSFHGKKLRAIKNYDKYLKKMYGNYMELPPEDKRIVHELGNVYAKVR